VKKTKYLLKKQFHGIKTYFLDEKQRLFEKKEVEKRGKGRNK
jgi:hypothetical protein